MFHYMYAEQTPELKRQEAELREFLENGTTANTDEREEARVH
jgi:hypothetical protein